jgi:hypothetical protein
MAVKSKANVISFKPRRDTTGEDELSVGLPPFDTARRPITGRPEVIDLSGKPKVWFVIGAGRTGKTTLTRFAAEIVTDRGGSPIYAAADPQNRSLANYIEGVAQPPTNDATATSRWLEELLHHAMDEKTSALIDLGGGDTSLHKLLVTVPDLAAELEGAGVAPVAVYLLGPRIDDLAALASFERLGFQPAATMLVCNEGLADPMMDEPFARVQRHSAYRGAVERGAVEIWMPRLDASVAQEIEAKRLDFGEARDAATRTGRVVSPLGPFDRSRVRRWMSQMAAELAPVTSWLP